MISSQYNGNSYTVTVNRLDIQLTQDEIDEIQSYDFYNNRYGDSILEIKEKLENEEIDHKDTMNMASKDFDDLQLKIDRLTDKYEDHNIFEELTELSEYCNMLSERY